MASANPEAAAGLQLQAVAVAAAGEGEGGSSSSLGAVAAVSSSGELVPRRAALAVRKERVCTAKERISRMPPCAAGKRSSIYRGVTRYVRAARPHGPCLAASPSLRPCYLLHPALARVLRSDWLLGRNSFAKSFVISCCFGHSGSTMYVRSNSNSL